MAATFWESVGAQLKHPQGGWGAVTGRLMRVLNARVNKLTVAALAPAPGEHIIELGCGPGDAVRLLLASHADVRVTAIDLSAVMIEQAERLNRVAVESARLRLFRGDFNALPFPNGSADAVLAVNVAYFMQEARVIAEVRRVLRPGGRLVIYATHASTMRTWPFASGHSHRHFDETALASLFASGGLRLAEEDILRVDAGLGVRGLIAIGRI
jgi:ubiquinone/menaquinone biosynthesis C-methylase UbiE